MRPLLRLEYEQHCCAISVSYFWTTPKFSIAFLSHLISIYAPLVENSRDLLVAGKVTCISFLEGQFHLFDLPLVCLNKLANRFSGKK